MRAIAIWLGCMAALATLLGGFRGRAATAPSEMPVVNEAIVATVPAPPRLVTEILNGEPIAVLYMTRADEQVLMRCYPGYVPVVSHRAMGPNPQANTAPQEGVLRCLPPLPHIGNDASSLDREIHPSSEPAP